MRLPSWYKKHDTDQVPIYQLYEVLDNNIVQVSSKNVQVINELQ